MSEVDDILDDLADSHFEAGVAVGKEESHELPTDIRASKKKILELMLKIGKRYMNEHQYALYTKRVERL